tara:strand:+ start:466 stop:1053 length:588 start_codon:yes stop_codon:yes gene_type:complete
MTAISPLESIHKKGLFGDHEKKDENELLQIAEVKDLTIVQIVKFKKAKVEIKNIKIDNLNLPENNSKVFFNNQTRILWNAPKTWLIISNKKNIIDDINKNCTGENFGVTDISHSRAAIQIKGFNSRDVLKKGCPLNINEFEKNKCAGSVFHGITILVDCINDKPDTFNIFVLRSFGESFYHHITDAALEYGYLGV